MSLFETILLILVIRSSASLLLDIYHSLTHDEVTLAFSPISPLFVDPFGHSLQFYHLKFCKDAVILRFFSIIYNFHGVGGWCLHKNWYPRGILGSVNEVSWLKCNNKMLYKIILQKKYIINLFLFDFVKLYNSFFLYIFHSIEINLIKSKVESSNWKEILNHVFNQKSAEQGKVIFVSKKRNFCKNKNYACGLIYT